MRFRKYATATLVLVLALLTGICFAEQEVDPGPYVEQLESKVQTARLRATYAIYHHEIFEPQILDVLSGRLEKSLTLKIRDKILIREFVWAIKIIGLAGREEHRQLLQKVAAGASTRDLRREAKSQLEAFDYFVDRQAVKADRSTYGAALSKRCNELVNLLRSEDLYNVRGAAMKIVNSLLMPEAVYAEAELALLRVLKTDPEDCIIKGKKKSSLKQHKDTVAWLCRTIGASGLERYEKTLISTATAFPEDPKIKDNIEKAMQSIPVEAQRNRVLADRRHAIPALSDKDNGIANLLRSDELTYKWEAGRQIQHQIPPSPILLDMARDELLEGLDRKPQSYLFRGEQCSSAHNSIQTLVQLCMALGYSQETKYLTDLDKIHQAKVHSDLKDAATKAADELHKYQQVEQRSPSGS